MPLVCPKCHDSRPDGADLARHLNVIHGFTGDEAVAAAARIEEETRRAAGIPRSPLPPAHPGEQPMPRTCSNCRKPGHKAPTCPEKKGTAPAGGGSAKAKKPAKASPLTHKKRTVKTRASVASNGSGALAEAVRELSAKVEAGRAAERELAEVRKLVGA
jgi:hypothetical protein